MNAALIWMVHSLDAKDVSTGLAPATYQADHDEDPDPYYRMVLQVVAPATAPGLLTPKSKHEDRGEHQHGDGNIKGKQKVINIGNTVDGDMQEFAYAVDQPLECDQQGHVTKKRVPPDIEHKEKKDGNSLGILTDRVPPDLNRTCLLYTSPSPRYLSTSRMPSSA